jgi:hypothetical protein
VRLVVLDRIPNNSQLLGIADLFSCLCHAQSTKSWASAFCTSVASAVTAL